jgi:hypothetical protein
MTAFASYFALSAAAFAGAFVSGLAGFAFSAVAGAILLHILPPLEAVPLMMACSVGVQAANLWALRDNIQWKGSLVLITGGLLGVPIAALPAAECRYPNLPDRIRRHGRLVCRLYAVPAGADLSGENGEPRPQCPDRIWRRADRRPDRDARCASDHLVRHSRPAEKPAARPGPALHRGNAGLRAGAPAATACSRKSWWDFVISVPALAAGTALGILMFRSVNELVFRRTILIVLFFSGLSLVF